MFNIQQLCILSTLYFMCFVLISEETANFFPVHRQLIGFYNGEEKCLLRGTNWVFK